MKKLFLLIIFTLTIYANENISLDNNRSSAIDKGVYFGVVATGGIRGGYEINDYFALEAGSGVVPYARTYYTSMVFTFNINETHELYGLAGVAVYALIEEPTEIVIGGFNLGIGYRYNLSQHTSVVVDLGLAQNGIGCNYKF